MNKMNPEADFFFHTATKWREEFEQLRMIILDRVVWSRNLIHGLSQSSTDTIF